MAKLVVIGVIIGAVVYFGFLRRSSSGGGGEVRLWSKLFALTRDREVAERLVAGEQQRNPELSEAQCILRAIRQVQQDRR